MVKLLFQDAESSIYFNGNMMTSFQIRRGVRQGCPLPPYLFLLVSEILNIMIKWMTNRGEMHRVFLLGGEREQTTPRMLMTLPYHWQEMKMMSTKQWNFSINSSSYLGWSAIGIRAWPFGTVPWTSDPAGLESTCGNGQQKWRFQRCWAWLLVFISILKMRFPLLQIKSIKRLSFGALFTSH